MAHLLYLHGKPLLMRPLIKNHQTYTILPLGMMLATYALSHCVNSCRAVFICVGILIQKPVNSHLDKIGPIALELCSRPIFKEQDQNVKFKASTLQANRRIWTVSVLMEFFSHWNKLFEAMGWFYNLCPCQELRPSFTEEDSKRGSKERDVNEMRKNYRQRRGFTVIRR